MALKGDKSSTTENCTLRMTGLAWTGSTMSQRKVVVAPLNPDKIHPGFSRLEGSSPIYLITDACKRSVELPGSTRIRLTSKSPIPKDRIRASRYGCNIQVGSTRGKMIVPSIRWVLPPVNQGWMELIRSHMDAARISLCLFRLESYSSSRGPPWMYFITALGAIEALGVPEVRLQEVSPPLASERMYYFRCPAFMSLSTK